MGFRGEMHHVSDLVFFHDLDDARFVAQIHFFESVFGMACEFFQVNEMAGVGKAIEIDEPFDFGPVDYMMDNIRADKTGAAGDEQIHSFNCRLSESSGPEV